MNERGSRKLKITAKTNVAGGWGGKIEENAQKEHLKLQREESEREEGGG